MPAQCWSRRIAALIALPLVLILAGCGRLHATITFEDAENLTMTMDFAFTQEVAETYMAVGSAVELCESLEEEGSEFSGAAPYEEDGL